MRRTRSEMGAKVLVDQSTPKDRRKVTSVGKDGHPLRPRIGGGQCVCGQCGSGFGGVRGFDAHQTLDGDGNVVCWDPLSLGMTKNQYGWWVTSYGGGDD